MAQETASVAQKSAVGPEAARVWKVGSSVKTVVFVVEIDGHSKS